MMRDQDFGMVEVRGFGVFNFRVGNPEKFLQELLGTAQSFRTDDVVAKLRTLIISGMTQAIAASNIPALDLAMKYSDLSAAASDIVGKRFSDLGLNLASLIVENISLPEELRKAMQTRTSRNIMGSASEHAQWTAADSMKVMAENAHKGQGGGGMNMGAMGMNWGVGMGMANMFNQNMAQMNAMNQQQQAPAAAAPAVQVLCPSCRKPNGPNARFCGECGAAMQATCSKCGKPVTGRFCGECGQQQ
jgi:membrane protease subunit (stomatin/prohibitin family)